MKASSCESKHSPLGKITTVAVTMSPPQKLEVSPQLADTSSQASIEEAEASLKDLPSQNLSDCCCLKQWECQSPSGPIRTPDQCQQSHRQYASPQEVPRCQETESYLGTGGNVMPG